jgi:HSP20 family molecular chaperone IbpA
MKENIMANEQALSVKEKKELQAEQEKTVPGKFFLPYTDIYETDNALVVVMEMPGVEKTDIDIKLDKNKLSVEGRIDFEIYKSYRPLYTEYNVGHFSRSFTLSSQIDTAAIEANVAEGVLTLNLPKVKEAAPSKITIN